MTHIHVPLYRNFEFLHEKYVLKGHSVAQIAREILSSKSAVREGLKAAGIELRKPHLAHGNLSQPRYGRAVRGGKEVTNHSEATVIKQIEALHLSGLSFRKIAQTLDKMGVPTKNKGQKWHPEMVSRILKAT